MFSKEYNYLFTLLIAGTTISKKLMPGSKKVIELLTSSYFIFSNRRLLTSNKRRSVPMAAAITAIRMGCGMFPVLGMDSH